MSRPRDYNTPYTGKNGRKYPSVADRFWSNVDKNGPNGCWLWTASTNQDGYGRLRVYGNPVQSHRLAYEMSNGPIPEGLQIDHLCRVRNCCNPDHMEAVTQYENLMRGEGACAKHARKTHCIHGHPFTPDNTYIDPNGHRECRICKRAANLRDKARRRAAKKSQKTQRLLLA